MGLLNILVACQRLLSVTPESEAGKTLHADVEKFFKAMDDDFNTPQAVAVLFELAKKLNIILLAAESSDKKAAVLEHVRVLRGLGVIIGLAQSAPSEHFQFKPEVNLEAEESDSEAGLSDEQIDSLIVNRTKARADKNFAESDRIRDELVANGITVLDSKAGTTWRRN